MIALTRNKCGIPVLNLREFRHQAATDNRDKIFGILGLTYPNDVQTGFLSHLVDFNDFRQCFFHFAIRHITHTGTLDVLGASCYGAQAQIALPYWCPDWSFKKPDCDTNYTFGAYNTPPHHAGMREKARDRCETMGSILAHTGLRLRWPRRLRIDNIWRVDSAVPDQQQYVYGRDQARVRWTLHVVFAQAVPHTTRAFGKWM